jgi:hypothetical protein
MKPPAALMAAQPGGMSADILLAHNIAAAKVRRQFQWIRYLPVTSSSSGPSQIHISISKAWPILSQMPGRWNAAGGTHR